MQDDFVEVQVCIAMNEDGDYSVSHDEEVAHDGLNDDYGGTVRSMTKLTIRMRKPKMIEASATLPDDGTEFTLTVDKV